jgi:hypothetical protein
MAIFFYYSTFLYFLYFEKAENRKNNTRNTKDKIRDKLVFSVVTIFNEQFLRSSVTIVPTDFSPVFCDIGPYSRVKNGLLPRI